MKKNNKTIRLSENKLRGIIKESVHRILFEGYYGYVKNDDGEPIGMDYYPDQYEQEEIDWEENMRCADDPIYAREKEFKSWLAAAHRAFESQGIQVPYEVEEELAKLMREKQRAEHENKIIKTLESYAEFITSLGYKAEPFYEPESYDECESYGIEVLTNEDSIISKEDKDKIIAAAKNEGIKDIEDYIYLGHYY